MSDPREVLTRPAPPPDLVVRYGDLAEHVADVRLPGRGRGSPAPAPLVLVVHGGFWRAEYDRKHTGPLCTGLADAGYATAAVEFRRTGQPTGGWPGTFDDIARAVDTVPALVAEAARGAVDAARPVLLGHSAGGHLVLWSAGRHRLPTSSRWHRRDRLAVRGVVALAPVADLATASRLRLGDGAVDALLGGSPDEVPERYAAADPMRLLPIDVPAVVVHGKLDQRVPLEQSIAFHRAAEDAGDSVALRVLAGVEHFGVIDPRSPAWAEVLEAVRSLLR